MTNKYIYNDYLKNISSKYAALLENVSANYNFDLGTEFELVLCEMLQHILPSKYGVCRGFLVSKDGEKAGDDIIIYDRLRFPQIRLLGENDLAHKKEIPIEAAYAYIEAKNSLINGKDKSFKKALAQVSDVKKLVSTREEVSVKNAFNPYVAINMKISGGRKNWPKSLNPFFAAIIAPHVRDSQDPHEVIKDANKVVKELCGNYDDEYEPDLIIAGSDICFLPRIKGGEKEVDTYFSPFYITDSSKLLSSEAKGHAFSIGMCSLMYALDTICLGIMPWPSILMDGLDK